MEGSRENNGQQFAVFEHLTGRDKGYRFWSTNSKDDKDQTISHDENGKRIVAYKLVWFTDSEDDAIRMCHEHYTQDQGLSHHLQKMNEDMCDGLLAYAQDEIKKIVQERHKKRKEQND